MQRGFDGDCTPAHWYSQVITSCPKPQKPTIVLLYNFSKQQKKQQQQSSSLISDTIHRLKDLAMHGVWSIDRSSGPGGNTDMHNLTDGLNVLKKVILWKQIMHQRSETRVCKFSGPD